MYIIRRKCLSLYRLMRLAPFMRKESWISTPLERQRKSGLLSNYQKYKSIRKQIAIKLPNMMPSLLFLDPILAIKLLMPGT